VNALEELETTIGEAARRVGPAVAGIGRGWHPGSGVVIAEGQVLTSAHNVRGDETAVTLEGRSPVAARVVAADGDMDLALLSVDTGDITPVDWAPAEAPVQIGAAVVALANPGGRGLRATLGFVSAVDRSFRGPRGSRITGCIEHSAPLPRGSAGGPIVDSAGRLLGLNAIRLTGGLILAIGADDALRQRVEALGRGELSSRPRLGVAVAPPYVGRRLRRAVGLPERDGVLVRAVEADSPAAAAGIERGDLIVGAGSRPVEAIDALHEVLKGVTPESELELEILRGAEEKTVSVSFGEAREAAER
jgi:S1-C subfamily serine protease